MPEEDMILEEHFYPRSPQGERPPGESDQRR